MFKRLFLNSEIDTQSVVIAVLLALGKSNETYTLASQIGFSLEDIDHVAANLHHYESFDQLKVELKRLYEEINE